MWMGSNGCLKGKQNKHSNRSRMAHKRALYGQASQGTQRRGPPGLLGIRFCIGRENEKGGICSDRSGRKPHHDARLMGETHAVGPKCMGRSPKGKQKYSNAQQAIQQIEGTCLDEGSDVAFSHLRTTPRDALPEIRITGPPTRTRTLTGGVSFGTKNKEGTYTISWETRQKNISSVTCFGGQATSGSPVHNPI